MREELQKLKNMPITDPVAELRVYVEISDGQKKCMQIKVGRPFQMSDMYICQLEGVGPIQISSPYIGDNSFQSLALAIQGIRGSIHTFVKKSSCRLLYGDDYITLEDLDKIIFANGLESET